MLSNRYQDLQQSIWDETYALINKYNAVNFCGGKADFPIEDFAKGAMALASQSNSDQYARGNGDIRLVNQVANIYGRKLGREINPLSEVLVTTGAAEAIAVSALGLLNPGDEVILFEPFFMYYTGWVANAGGKWVYVPLIVDDWGIDYDALENAITERTKMIIFNNPQNPTGRLYNEAEIRELANFLGKYPNIVVISDEVYEEHIFNDSTFFPLSKVMWDRCISIYSGGKLFSVTGWKIGWAIGCESVLYPLKVARQFTTINCNSVAQVAIADMLETAEKPYKGFENYYAWLAASFKTRSEQMHDILTNCTAFRCRSSLVESGYFLWAEIDTSDLDLDKYCSDGVSVGHGFIRWLAETCGVAALPISAFYSSEHAHQAKSWVRFTFSKSEEQLEELRKRLNIIN